jgi:hypothetical protein
LVYNYTNFTKYGQYNILTLRLNPIIFYQGLNNPDKIAKFNEFICLLGLSYSAKNILTKSYKIDEDKITCIHVPNKFETFDILNNFIMDGNE